ncbi:hypothetical protein [uncultured Anaerococcus sp.]|uniref:hypothetical protein n=1 Tax=uncultured Anaerococcus sp. TaxID=293428 RepID=UPI002889A81E|nr:hypothetical protein [uncultured Anaerococcus sp.]
MSLGFGGKCILISKDIDYLMFKYCSFNYNNENSEKAQNTFDGIIIVHKDYFPKPTISKKKIKKSNGKKVWIEKKKYPEVELEDFIKSGKISVENSTHASYLSENGIDRIALDLIFKLNLEYQKSGQTPDNVSVFY